MQLLVQCAWWRTGRHVWSMRTNPNAPVPTVNVHQEGVRINDFSKMDLLQVAQARPRWPLQFDCPDCLFASDFSQTLRPGLEFSVPYNPTGSDQVDPCSAVRSVRTTVLADLLCTMVGLGVLDLAAVKCQTWPMSQLAPYSGNIQYVANNIQQQNTIYI
jgi:hypothetical protein